jgi:hypothetical protein
MGKDSIQSYLNALGRQLWLRGLSDADTLAEIEGHLLESAERGLRNGLSREDAERRALERFGSVRVISSAFEKERIGPLQKKLLAVGVISGLFIAYVDSRPTWDDTGITAGVILLVCGILALAGCQRPWLLALAVGGWIPLFGLLVTHNYGSILALIIAFIGAYAGWAFRLGIRRVLHTA